MRHRWFKWIVEDGGRNDCGSVTPVSSTLDDRCRTIRLSSKQFHVCLQLHVEFLNTVVRDS